MIIQVFQRNMLTSMLYTPFDVRSYIHHQSLVERPRNAVMRHINKRVNISLIVPKMTKDNWSALVTQYIAGHKSATRYDRSYIFPLYIYKIDEETKGKSRLLVEDQHYDNTGRRENFTKQFREYINSKYGHHPETQRILGYIYAILHSSFYQSKYQEFLRVEFPRIPFLDDRKTFDDLATIGDEILQAHLFQHIPSSPTIDISKGNYAIEAPIYIEQDQRLYINREQYFSPIPMEVWKHDMNTNKKLTN